MSCSSYSSNRFRKAPHPHTPPLGGTEGGQGLVEFALILPLLLLLILGIIEAGRLMVIYSSISSGSKQGVRYGSVAGSTGQMVGGVPLLSYQDCQGIRNHVRQAMPLNYLTDNEIQITYSPGDINQRIGLCAPNAITPTMFGGGPLVINDGYQIIITTTTTYIPIVPIVPIPPLPIRFVSARTIFPSIEGPTATPRPAPDLALDKTVNRTTATYDTPLVYTITVSNLGPSAASNVTLTDTWTSGTLSSVAFRTVPSGWSCSVAANTASCTKFTSMVSNTVATFVIDARVAIHNGTIRNSSGVTMARADPVPTNNSDWVDTVIVSGPDLIMNKQASAPTVQTGELITYVLSITNGGEDVRFPTGSTLRVTDTLPTNANFLSVVSLSTVPFSSWVCNATGGVVTCTHNGSGNATNGTLFASGATINVARIVVRAPNSSATVVNQAMLQATGATAADGNSGNNSASVTTAVSDNVDLYIGADNAPGMGAFPDPVNPPAAVTYNMIIGNATGVATARNVQVTFNKDGNTPAITAGGTNWLCGGFSGNQVVCNYTQPITPGTIALDLEVIVSATVGSTSSLLANATVASTTQTDVDSSDNTATETVIMNNCNPNVPGPGGIQMSTNVSSVPADGINFAEVYVNITSECGSLITASSYFTLTSSRGASDTITLIPSYPNPSTSGVVGYRVRSLYVGTSTYSAQVSTGGNTYNGSTTSNVDFNACNRVSATTSSVTGAPAEVFADGINYADIVVTLKDSCNSNVSASTLVTLTSSRGGADSISLAPGASNPTTTGIVTFRVRSATVGTSTYSAQSNTSGTLVSITDTENVSYFSCVTGVSLGFGSKNLQFSLNNATTILRRLTNLTLTFPSANNPTQTATDVSLTDFIWTDNSGVVSPLTLAPANWNTNDRTIPVSGVETLAFIFKHNVASGLYTANLTFDDNAGARLCTVTLTATAP